MHIKRIFLASSNELKADREAVEIAINRLNKRWVHRGLFIHLEIWEDFDDTVSATRKQDDYNKALRNCDMAAVLAYSKVGKYTAEEFQEAIAAFKAQGKPKVLVYLKQNPPAARPQADVASLAAFEARVKALGHFANPYTDATDLCAHLVDQLERQVSGEGWSLETDLKTPAPNRSTGGIQVGGSNQGIANTGHMSIHTGGGAFVGGGVFQGTGSTFAGRDAFITHAPAASAPVCAVPAPAPSPLDPVAQVVAQVPDEAARRAAEQLLQEIRDLAQQAPADKAQADGLLARLSEHLLGLVPSAAQAVGAALGTPLLQGVAGPVTAYVLGKLGIAEGA